MKIGIMTFWWSEDNYGQLLQCFALQKYLRDAGHDAYLIRYDPRNDYYKTPFWKKVLKAFNPVKLFKFLSYKNRKRNDKLEKQNNPRSFEDFRNKYIKQSEKIYYSYQELKENPPEADVYIVGSDQIWNWIPPVNYVINILNAYLLNFGDASIKRISYAASFGKEQLDEVSISIFSALLKNFDYVSVREKSGIEICRKCGVSDAEWVPDPTMLLEKDVYRFLYKNEFIKKPEKPYCLLYMLGNECNYSIQLVYDWAKKMNLEVIYITGNLKHDKYEKYYATIPEWIYLTEHAEYVITNSYHCSVFSFVFKKKFGVIPLEKHDAGMNNRFDALFQLFEIQERYIKSDLSVINDDINWLSISEKFEEIKNNCKLKNILN